MLGELEVRDRDTDVPIRGAKQRALLLLLLVRAGETVQADRLADDLWGDAPPAGWCERAAGTRVEAAARASASAVRWSSPAPAAIGSRPRTTTSMPCASSTEPHARHAALVQGDASVAADELRAALSLWRGPALDGSDDEGLLRREAQRLEELRWAVLEDRIDADLQCGRHGELVAELEDLVATLPAPRAPSRLPHACPLSIGSAGRGTSRLPGGPRRARRGARARPRSRSPRTLGARS